MGKCWALACTRPWLFTSGGRCQLEGCCCVLADHVINELCAAGARPPIPATLLLRTSKYSFNHFIGSDLLKIIRAKGNERVTCDADPNFYLKCAGQAIWCPHCLGCCATLPSLDSRCSALSCAFLAMPRSGAGCRYTNIYVGRPSLEEDYIQVSAS